MVSTRSLPPGGEAQIKAKLRTAGISGPIRKQITVFTNDPVTPRLVLSLSGEIVADVIAKPKQLSFGEVPIGSDPSREFSLELGEPGKVRIVGVTVEDERFRLTHVNGDEATGASYELRLSDSSEQGWVTTKVNVALAGAAEETFQIPVTASIVGDLRYAKSFALQRKGDDFVPSDVSLKSRTGRAVKVLGAEDPDGVLGVEIVQLAPDEVQLKLTVKEPGGDASAPSRGKLVVRTNDPTEPIVEMSYTVHYRARPASASDRPSLRRRLDVPPQPPSGAAAHGE